MTDDRISTWERLFKVASDAEERKKLWELAETSREMDVARAGFARTTYAKGGASK